MRIPAAAVLALLATSASTWAKYPALAPELRRATEANLGNYGDARFNRMFTQGVDLLFGAEAGRAKGKARELRVGEEFTVDAEKPGIFMKPTVVPHTCKVVSATGGTVVVSVDWKINGFDPATHNGIVTGMRGADIHGVAKMTFLAQGGLLTRLEETVERTDQTSPGRRGVAQWTRKVTAKREFSLVKE